MEEPLRYVRDNRLRQILVYTLPADYKIFLEAVWEEKFFWYRHIGSVYAMIIIKVTSVTTDIYQYRYRASIVRTVPIFYRKGLRSRYRNRSKHAATFPCCVSIRISDSVEPGSVAQLNPDPIQIRNTCIKWAYCAN